MTYEEFSKKQKEILEEAKQFERAFKLDEFVEKMNQLVLLEDKYLLELFTHPVIVDSKEKK